MTWEEYSQVQDTILDLIEKEKAYCAGYVANNPDDKRRRELIRDYIVSGMNNVLAALHANVKTRKITVD